ncbi:hypothetical protein PG984_005662 [Apiospora sp. TS-2023a]
MGSSCLKTILDNLLPCVAAIRHVELDTNTKLLHALPFNGDHAEALKIVLDKVSDEDRSKYEVAMSYLERCWDKPQQVTDAMIDFLRSYTLVTNDELRLACWRHMSKDNVETLQHHTFGNLRRMQPDICYRLSRIYNKPKLNKRALLHIIDWIVENATEEEREALYFSLTHYVETSFLSSDITRLVARCNSDIAKEALHVITEEWKDDSMEALINCLKESQAHQLGTKMDPDYTAELSRLIQAANSYEGETFYNAVDIACTRLCALPRNIARNYDKALSRFPYGNGLPNRYLHKVSKG